MPETSSEAPTGSHEIAIVWWKSLASENGGSFVWNVPMWGENGDKDYLR